ncbi:MAG: uroporphyrinogen-III synthase [Alphaproteobacteria bacterium]|nr:uroporphyrinogen-III synthase [Alphaproteobacteria bacterium]
MRALVTRPREDAEGLIAALATRAIEALVEPLMEIHWQAAEALDLAEIQAILCTSANGVRALARASGERGVPLLAVGDTTAARARAEGFGSVESAGGDVGDLARLVRTRLRPQNGPLLHVAGNVVAGDLVGLLRAQGFTVERRVLYEARAAAALSPAAVDSLREGAIAFALFLSPRTAAIFARLADVAGVGECCARVTAVSISGAADANLAGLPWHDRRIAERPNQSAILDALDQALGRWREIYRE